MFIFIFTNHIPLQSSLNNVPSEECKTLVGNTCVLIQIKKKGKEKTQNIKNANKIFNKTKNNILLTPINNDVHRVGEYYWRQDFFPLDKINGWCSINAKKKY